jgi:hypothetical protein
MLLHLMACEDQPGERVGEAQMCAISARGELCVRLTLRSQDFELAFWQLTYLVVAPRRVYKQTYHQWVMHIHTLSVLLLYERR